jgi:hypothetical protein
MDDAFWIYLFSIMKYKKYFQVRVYKGKLEKYKCLFLILTV